MFLCILDAGISDATLVWQCALRCALRKKKKSIPSLVTDSLPTQVCDVSNVLLSRELRVG